MTHLLETKQKIGLALGGGAALGWAHIGALRALTKAGIPIHMVAGTSIGALVGGAYLAGKLDALEDIARSMDWKRMLSLTDFRMHGRGLLDGTAIMRELEKHFGQIDIEDLPVPFAAVAADLITGQDVTIETGSLIDSIRASISLPGVFTPYSLQDYLFVDGGLANPLPVLPVRHLGADLVIAVDILGDYEGRAGAAGLSGEAENKNKSSSQRKRSLDNWPQPVKGVAKRFFPKNNGQPNLISVFITSAALISHHLIKARLSESPPEIYIAPKIGHITAIEFDRADELIAIGQKAVEDALPEIEMVVTQAQRNE